MSSGGKSWTNAGVAFGESKRRRTGNRGAYFSADDVLFENSIGRSKVKAR